MSIIFEKAYRSKKIEGQVALRSGSRTKRIKKQQVKAFLKKHFPDVDNYEVRVLNQYRKGTVATISCKDKKAIWK